MEFEALSPFGFFPWLRNTLSNNYNDDHTSVEKVLAKFLAGKSCFHPWLLLWSKSGHASLVSRDIYCQPNQIYGIKCRHRSRAGLTGSAFSHRTKSDDENEKASET